MSAAVPNQLETSPFKEPARPAVRSITARPPTGFWDALTSIRPGRTGIAMAVGLLGLSLVYFFLPWNSLFLLLLLSTSGLFIVAAWEAIVVARDLSRLQVVRSLPVFVGRNRRFLIDWTISNDGPRTVIGSLREVVPSVAVPPIAFHAFELPTGERATVTGKLTIPIRGQFRFLSLWIRLEGPWQLVEVQREFLSPSVIKILPEKFASREELQKDHGAELRLLDRMTRSRQHGTGTEFESLIEFREGDDPRRIDWRTTARTQRPVVRRFQVERHRDVMILIDCGRLMGTEIGQGTKLDCAIDSALILARVALQSGDRCGFGLYDDRVRRYVPPVSGVPSLRTLTETVYDASSDFRESDFVAMFATLQQRQSKRSLIVVISDIADAETSLQFRSALVRLAQRHVVLFAALRTPLFDQIIHQPVETMIDAGKKAVAFRLLQERRLAIQTLRHHGIIALDVEPSQLTAPLINQFIELRAQNRL